MAEPALGADGKPITPPPQPTKWYEGKADAITVGYLQNRGLHDKTPEEVALSVAKAHMEAEKFIGAPADQLIRLPKDPADTQAWDAVYQRLGALKDGERPDWTHIKTPDGKEIPKEIQDLATALGYRTRVNKDMAVLLGQEISKFINADIAKFGEERDAKLAVAKEALAKSWGPNAPGNQIVAENAMRALGVTPEQQQSAQTVLGYDKFMEMFRQIGVRMGEDKFISNAQGSGLPPQRTREQVQQRINELKNDHAWVQRYTNGGTGSPEHKELMNLQRLLLAPQT